MIQLHAQLGALGNLMGCHQFQRRPAHRARQAGLGALDADAECGA